MREASLEFLLVLNLFVDTLLCLCLFVLSPIVIMWAKQIEEAVVNLVAVQVFVILDDEIVRRVLNVRRSTFDVVENLTTNHPDSQFIV